MEHTIMDECDVEELTKKELFDLYGLVINEVSKREVTQELMKLVKEKLHKNLMKEWVFNIQ